ncbi:MAG: hypothetical protein PF503_10335 [Desulfobacula sp.]|nr:hypothetical protein [Desulfobacula sp.]
MKTNILIILFIFIIFPLPCNTARAKVKPPGNPNSAKGCAICHYRWIDTFFIEGKGSELVAYHSEKVVATRKMCMSCHDGSVMDSRKRVNANSGHKINNMPSRDMKIPKIFPLDESGKMQCFTCHTAHAVQSGPNAKDTIFMRTSNKESALCHYCHYDKKMTQKKENHPMGKFSQEGEENSPGPDSRVEQKIDPIYCETCHAAHGSPFENLLRISSKESGFCLKCHPDKNMMNSLGKRNPTHVVNFKPIKVTIPDSLIKKGGRLGQNGIITCQTCHKVHNNKNGDQLLLFARDQQSTQCTICHTTKKYIEKTDHDLIVTAPLSKNIKEQTPFQSGTCGVCHLVHNGRNIIKLWARDFAEGSNIVDKMCNSCHSETGSGKKKVPQVSLHPREEIVKSNKGKPDYIPIFDGLTGEEVAGGNITCPSCHNAHQWNSIQKAIGKGVNVEGDITNSFLRSQPLHKQCIGCHKTDSQLRIKYFHNIEKRKFKSIDALFFK